MAAQVTHTYGYTGGPVAFVVPAGITQLTLTVEGAGSPNRKGGLVNGTLPVTPGETLWLSVGESGRPNNGANGGGVAYGGGGAAGDGHGKAGGNGGGGASWIRRGSRDGMVLVVAGGAGGDSGDNGEGGLGGAKEGQDGRPGTSGSGKTFPAHGGTQSSRGSGGSSGGGKRYAGEDGGAPVLGRGGRGGQGPDSYGGGGGGGGWYPGGGGTASAATNNPGPANDKKFPGGGGGAGSNYAHPYIVGANSVRGGGDVGHGRIIIKHTAHPQPQRPPLPPTDVTINGLDAADELASRAVGNVDIVATVQDADIGDDLRLLLIPELKQVNSWRNLGIQGNTLRRQPIDDQGQEQGAVRITMNIHGLANNTLYEGMLYAVDEHGNVSARQDESGAYVTQGTKVSFWTNRPPFPPTLDKPRENTQISGTSEITFEWFFDDPDGETQAGFNIRWRAASTPTSPPGPWTYRWGDYLTKYVAPAGTFAAGVLYEWQVAVSDGYGGWSNMDDCVPNSFFVIGTTTPPVLLSPVRSQAVIADQPITFAWQFRDTSSAVSQVSANIRYRARGAIDWIVVTGDTLIPGANGTWTMQAGTFMPGFAYEWQAQTHTSTSQTSDWSEPQTFWTISTPGLEVPRSPIGSFVAKSTLGSGVNRAYIFRRGGKILHGELKNTVNIEWERVRDDISVARVIVSNFDDQMLRMLEPVHTWQHELVIFREANGVVERVWEGPISYIEDAYDTWTIHAGDVMRYAARRVIRQGYDDAFQLIGAITVPGGYVGGYQTGLRSVVERSEVTLMNAFCYDDPNILPYLTALRHPDDAKQSRVVPDYSRMVWEDIDDLAANAGLDYTVTGRRIILWDTHRPIGRLPELRESAFSAPPRIIEYGMQYANHYGVTDGSGVYGVASRGLDSRRQPLLSTGWVEMLATAYGVDEDKVADASTLTRSQRAALEASYSQQADRNIAHRWPMPVEVKLPSDVRLMPTVDLGINQLVPGVWMPIRAKSRVRAIAQWQKLDRVKVTQTAAGEQIQVAFSPAPNGGNDPDAAAPEEVE